jgi:HK97 family phage portal protein
MRIFGLEISRVKKALSPVADYRNGWRRILEPFAGAWQQNIEEKRESVVCYPTLYACLSRISQDIGKLPFLLKREDADGIWQTVQNPAYSPVLNKPNHYQTAQQFREAWTLSILQSGNTYVLKRRDNRGVVTALYVLDPCRVVPMVSDSGDVFYQINYPTAANLLPDDYPAEQIVLPAREIIHDRLNSFHHQLIGVPPLCAAYWPAVKNLKILKTSAEFFSNHAQPGGILTAPAGMSDEDAVRVQQFWQTNYGGENAGKVAVIGADLKYQAFATSATDAQLVEQMQYSDRQVCQPFGIPPYIVGVGEIPAGLKVDDITNTYYAFALQARIEAMEYLLDEGLGIARPLGVELDTEPLLRMDAAKRGEVWGKLTSDGIAAPNEARLQFGLKPLEGGDTVYMQQQDMPLDQVRLNTIVKPEPAPVVEEDDEALETANEEVRRLSAELWQRKALESAREAIR